MDKEQLKSSYLRSWNSLSGSILRGPFDDIYSGRCIVCLYWISIRIRYRHLVVELILNLVTARREWRSGGAPTNDQWLPCTNEGRTLSVSGISTKSKWVRQVKCCYLKYIQISCPDQTNKKI